MASGGYVLQGRGGKRLWPPERATEITGVEGTLRNRCTAAEVRHLPAAPAQSAY
jgi:hypothetical protein